MYRAAIWYFTVFSLIFSVSLSANEKVALPQDQSLPNDQRLEPLKDYNGYFPFTPSKTLAEWNKRAKKVREQILVACGLWPMPAKTPMNPVVHGLIDCGDFTIEKVYFETLPGFYLTGNLYRPKGKKGKRPTVLCPHGHAENGRFADKGLKEGKRLVDIGAEYFPEAARNYMQPRYAHMARMGYIVFHYDMIGYADNEQISFELAHKFAKQRPEMNKPNAWGLFSPQAESYLQSVFGLQTWNSIRAVDFVLTLPDVDPEKLGVTGSSGGGTQSMILAAIDPRIKVSMPVVMVSTAMQGGCTCENASLLRIDTGNIEFSALFAPKPQGITQADDWTKEVAQKGFPELQKHYAMLGSKEDMILAGETRFKHNYNAVSRLAMYKLFNKHLGVNADIKERESKYRSKEELTVWNAEHPKPEGGAEFEIKLMRQMHSAWEKEFEKLIPKDSKGAKKYKETVGAAVDVIVGKGLSPFSNTHFQVTGRSSWSIHTETLGLLKNSENGSELPTIILKPKKADGEYVVWVTREGKQGLFEKDGVLKKHIYDLLKSGKTVIGMDLLFQGEFLPEGKTYSQTRKVKNPREAPAYTFGFNHTLFVNRVHDLMSAVALAQSYKAKKIHLVGINGAGHWVAAARAQSGSAVYSAAVGVKGFKFGNVDDYRDVDFQPGGAKYGDVEGMISLSAPNRLWFSGSEGENVKLVESVYKAERARTKLKVDLSKEVDKSTQVVEWLLSQ